MNRSPQGPKPKDQFVEVNPGVMHELRKKKSPHYHSNLEAGGFPSPVDPQLGRGLVSSYSNSRRTRVMKT